MPLSIFTSVDLPAPFSPMSAVPQPRGSSRLTRSSARTPPKDLRMSVSARSEVDTDVRGASEDFRELRHVAGVVDERLAHGAVAVGAEADGAHATRGHRPRDIATARQVGCHLQRRI